MKIQLALDRLSINEAISITKLVESEIDWIEVGTSLIKEFGMQSVKEIKAAFPNKIIVADTKTMDNGKYELEMSFQAGADIVTVMGSAPLITIKTCLEIAKKHQKKIMIDLLNTSEEQVNSLLPFTEAIFCEHISKDEQELSGKYKAQTKSRLKKQAVVEVAAAGGITLEAIHQLIEENLDVAIIGSAITKAKDPAVAAHAFKQTVIKGGVLS
ncbi:3-hexulose-6-phosphate synthase [Niallia sp. 03133]|uniref:3-hexulose-6-phosphate synthase n=1 Tax=Niallia sp. 03133 TaxID=3458060 RepID=UPI004043D7C6